MPSKIAEAAPLCLDNEALPQNRDEMTLQAALSAIIPFAPARSRERYQRRNLCRSFSTVLADLLLKIDPNITVDIRSSMEFLPALQDLAGYFARSLPGHVVLIVGKGFLVDLTIEQFFDKDESLPPVCATLFEKGYIALTDQSFFDYVQALSRQYPNTPCPVGMVDLLTADDFPATWSFDTADVAWSYRALTISPTNL